MEAAEIDGANSWQKLRSITLPLVAPAFTVGLFLSLSNCFKLYDQNLALTNGGPFDSTEMIALNIYNTAFRYNDLGLAQAKAVIFLVIVGGNWADAALFQQTERGGDVMTAKKIGRGLLTALGLVLAAFFISPILILIVNSFKSLKDIYLDVLALPNREPLRQAITRKPTKNWIFSLRSAIRLPLR